MPKVNQCQNCDAILEEGDINVHTTTDPYCTGDSPDWIEWSCGVCNSEDIIEVWMCEMCEENPTADGSDNCQSCDDKIDAEEEDDQLQAMIDQQTQEGIERESGLS